MATLQNIGKIKYRGKDGQWHPLPVVVQDTGCGVSTISGKGAPTSETQGEVNQLYRDEDTQRLYICTSTDGGYTWSEVSGGGSGGGSVDVDATLTKAGQAADAKAAGDAIGKKIDKAQGTGNAGKILGIGADGNVTPQNKPAQALAGAAAPTTATAGVVGQEYYVIVNNAVTEIYVCTAVANGTYTWDKVEFGGGNTTGVSLGITGASVGQIAKITAVDAAGKPTEWAPVDMPNRLDVTVSMGDNGWVVSHKFAEIKAAYDAGRAVQLIDTDTFRKYSLMGFFPGSIEGVTYADFRFIDSGGDIWEAEINSNDKIEFAKGSTFVTLYGDVPQNTPKAITYSTANGIGYADFIPYIEIQSMGDALKEQLVIGPAYFYVMPNAYAPFVLKNLVNPYTLTRLSYSEPEFGTENNTFEASYLVTDSFGQQIKATCQVLLTESGLGDLVWNFEVRDSLTLKSSTEGSTKKFKITVDDSGTISATEITN